MYLLMSLVPLLGESAMVTAVAGPMSLSSRGQRIADG